MQINEKNFIEELKAKNEKALEYVIQNYTVTMRSAIGRILYSYPQDAEECLYDCIFKVWTHIDSFNPDKSSFTNWIAAVAKYSALDKLRKLTRAGPMLYFDELQVTDEKRHTDNEKFNEFFSELISCLNDGDKDLFKRLFWYGETYDEISLDTKKDKNILFNHVSRGRKKIIRNNPGLFKKERR